MPTFNLEALESLPAGTIPDGWYPIRRVDLDGVQLVETDTGAYRLTAGEHGKNPHFGRVQNIPGRGPAWMRLIFRECAYGAESDSAQQAIAEAIEAENAESQVRPPSSIERANELQGVSAKAGPSKTG